MSVVDRGDVKSCKGKRSHDRKAVVVALHREGMHQQRRSLLSTLQAVLGLLFVTLAAGLGNVPEVHCAARLRRVEVTSVRTLLVEALGVSPVAVGAGHSRSSVNG
jgi:hypothetical protein